MRPNTGSEMERNKMGSEQTLNVLLGETPFSIRAHLAREAMIELEKVLGGTLFFEKPAIERAIELCHDT